MGDSIKRCRNWIDFAGAVFSELSNVLDGLSGREREV